MPTQRVLNLPANAEVEDALAPYGFRPDPAYCERVRTYIGLLLRWNQKISLTAVTQPLEILRFHFGESLMGIGVAGIESGRLADVGSGAGLPGLPIAMAKPRLQALLIEASGKKAVFLEELRRELGLKNVSVHKGRAESVPEGERFEFVAARAVGRHAKLLDWASGRLAASGKVILWFNSEGLAEAKRATDWNWREPTKIPGTRDRLVAIGQLRSGAE
jgi:16S rRNA (guanine527-N7)-methyltransferase